MNRIVISKSNSIYENLAIEEELFCELKDGECILFLWQPDKTLVLGNNQSAYLECNMPYCKEHQIAIARRMSGGGCVYQDLGNLNYSFLYYKDSAYKNNDDKNFCIDNSSCDYNNVHKNNNFCKNSELYENNEVCEDDYVAIILNVLKQYSLNNIEQKKNDIFVNNKKVSGIAYYEEDGKRILHGTLLVDVNMNHLVNSLNVNIKKLEFNGVESVRTRVANLREFDALIQVDTIREKIIKEFLEQFKSGQVEYIETANDKKLCEKYKDDSWIFGESPTCSFILEEKTSKGLFQLVFSVEDGTIKNAKVYTDTDSPCDFTKFLEQIEHSVYEEQQLYVQWNEQVMKFGKA